MSVWHWLYEIGIGTIEIVLIGKEFLGLEIREGWKKFIALLGTFCISVICLLLSLDNTLFSLLWVFLISFCMFKGPFLKLIQSVLVIYIMQAIMDVFVWSVAILIIPPVHLPNSEAYNLKCGLVGLSMWFAVLVLLKIRKWKVSAMYQGLSAKQTILLILGLLSMSFFIGSIQGFLFNQMTVRLKKFSLLFCVLSVFFVIFVYGILTQNVQKRKSLEEIIRLNNQYMDLQKKYYQKTVEKYEELRSYRHDIKNHIQIMNRFCEEKSYDDLAEYIKRLDGDYAATASVQTGNIIVDCLLAEMLENFKNDDTLEVSILGRLPEMLPLENVDICILFSNAFRNAEEALQKQSGQKYFSMQIRQNEDELLIRISNSIIELDIDISITDKEDKEAHGYGTGNMKKVVEKYSGEIMWKVEQGMMNVDIYLPYYFESTRNVM